MGGKNFFGVTHKILFLFRSFTRYQIGPFSKIIVRQKTKIWNSKRNQEAQLGKYKKKILRNQLKASASEKKAKFPNLTFPDNL